MKQNSYAYKEEDSEKILKDMKECRMKYGYSAKDYFMYRIYEWDEERRREFISAVDTLKMASILNDRAQARILSHKYQTYELFKEFYKREIIKGKDIDAGFIDRNPRFIVKDDTGSRDAGIFTKDVRDYPSAQELIDEIRGMNNVVCEQLIDQDERLAAFHPAFVNTVKLRTVKTISGKTVIWACNFRTGKKGSVIDNSFMGGPAAYPDPETGVILTDACEGEVIFCETHPDTGMRFKGFQIPEWQELRNIVLKIAEKTDKLGYVGWDMALSKNGWVMVEGNSYAQMTSPQKSTLRPMKKELWDIVFEH